MGTPLYMDISYAVQLVKDYADLHTGGNVVAALNDMEFCYDDLDKEDRVAYNMYMDAGRKMFSQKG